ncbi:MAG: hypothetical protein WAN75_05655 [Xanthobacteraceae bacterium]
MLANRSSWREASGRSKLYRSVVPLTRLSQVRIEAYDTPFVQKGLVEGHIEFKRSASITGSGGALEHGSDRTAKRADRGRATLYR